MSGEGGVDPDWISELKAALERGPETDASEPGLTWVDVESEAYTGRMLSMFEMPLSMLAAPRLERDPYVALMRSVEVARAASGVPLEGLTLRQAFELVDVWSTESVAAEEARRHGAE